MKNDHKISIIVLCRNEEDAIEGCIKSLFSQEGTPYPYEILIADGKSTDKTIEIVHGLAKENSKIKLIENEKQIVSTGLNKAIQVASGDILIWISAHAEYQKDYIQKCVETLLKTGADNVGGPIRARGETFLQKLIGLTFQSPFSSGGAKSRRVNYSGPVDSVFGGCWFKKTFEHFGNFDETLVRNQDDEMNYRIIQGGGKIWQNPEIVFWYSPRKTVKDLFRQSLQYGYWKVRVIQKHHLPASWRHIAPPLFVFWLVLAGVEGFLFPSSLKMNLSILCFYFCLSLLFSIYSCLKEKRFIPLLFLPFLFFIIHLAYGLGFIIGIKDFILLKKFSNKYTQISR